jgi:hypothetical protein
MARVKHSSQGKRRSKTVPALGIAGMSLAVAGSGASASTAGAVADIPFQNRAPQVFTLGEEELTDVTLSTFYVFDKENSAVPRVGQQLAWRCGGCGRCGCGHGCGRGCGRCGCGCGLVYCGSGCSGCCISWGRCRWAC